MNIQVSQAPQPNLLGGQENMVRELKTSIFIHPDDNIPGTKQYFQIAKTIAGFINAEGGTLWLGVDDGGTAVGVEPDLAILGGGSASSCRGPWSNDVDMSFGGTADQYILKLKELVKAYLGPSAEKYIAGAQAAKVNGKIVVKVPVSKADVGYVAYVYKWLSRENKYSEELYQRVANGTSHLEGFARDEFIRGKCHEEFAKQLNSLEKNVSGLSKTELVDALKEMQREKMLNGAPVVVGGGLPLTEETLSLIGKPKGVVFDGEHLCDVKSWKEVFNVVYCKLNELNSVIFDSLPEQEPKWFKRGRRCPGCYKSKLGSAGDVRAVEISNKIYLWRETFVFRRVLSTCGIDAGRFMVRA